MHAVGGKVVTKGLSMSDLVGARLRLARFAATTGHPSSLGLRLFLANQEEWRPRCPSRCSGEIKMATIGIFKTSGDAFPIGFMTLQVQAKNVRIVSDSPRPADSSPSHPV